MEICQHWVTKEWQQQYAEMNQEFFGCFSRVVLAGLSDPTTLEVLACSEALELAQDQNLCNLIIASDCFEVINNIKKGASSS